MKKYTYHVTPGVKYAFPSCKTFVFSSCLYDVSFRFISMWNKVDKEIKNFKDAFSITASKYFLQIEVISTKEQDITAILIDDERIKYSPVMGSVSISNDIYAPAQIANFFPILSKKGVDLPKYYHNHLWGSIPFTWINHNIEHTYNCIWSPSFRFSEIIQSQWEPKNYIERIAIIPTVNTQLLLYYHNTGSTIPSEHGFSSTYFKATSPYLLSDPILPTRFYFKDQTLDDLIAGNEIELTWMQCPANELTTLELMSPLQIESTDINTSSHKACNFLSITTYHICDYQIRVEGRSFGNPKNWGLFDQVRYRTEA